MRTKFLLEWIMDDSMGRTVHKCTTKIERHDKFAKHLAFGGEGLLRSNDPADQEKAIARRSQFRSTLYRLCVARYRSAIHRA